jgi:hypothetical protein
LATAAYEIAFEGETQLDVVKRGAEASCVFIARDDDDSVVVLGIPDWLWLPGALGEEARELGETRWVPLSVDQLIEEKVQYERGTGRALRVKDRESLNVLRELLQHSPGNVAHCSTRGQALRRSPTPRQTPSLDTCQTTLTGSSFPAGSRWLSSTCCFTS